ALDAEEVELQLAAVLARRLEQILRRVQPAVGRSPSQRLEAADAARAWIDDRLEQGRNAPLAHQLGELVRRGVEPAQSQGRRVGAGFGHAPAVPIDGVVVQRITLIEERSAIREAHRNTEAEPDTDIRRTRRECDRGHTTPVPLTASSRRKSPRWSSCPSS